MTCRIHVYVAKSTGENARYVSNQSTRNVQMRATHCKYCEKELITNKQGRPREFCDEKCRIRFHRLSPCEQCGKPSWEALCHKCATTAHVLAKQYREALLWNQILDYRRGGMLNVEIAVRLKRSRHAIQSAVYRMRKAGITIPTTTYDPKEYMDRWMRRRIARGDIGRARVR